MWNKEERVLEVQKLLGQLGVTANYAGYFYLVEGICLAMEDKSRLLSITKEIYQELAIRHHTTVGRVERNMRTVIHVVWRKEPALLEKITRYPFDNRPSVGKFMGSIVESLTLKETFL